MMGFSLSSLRVQRRIAYVLIAMGVLVGIWRGTDEPGAGVGYGYVLDGIKARGIMVVLTRNAPTTYYFDRDLAPAGYEYELIEDFAAHLGVERADGEGSLVGVEVTESLAEGVHASSGVVGVAGLGRLVVRGDDVVDGEDALGGGTGGAEERVTGPPGGSEEKERGGARSATVDGDDKRVILWRSRGKHMSAKRASSRARRGFVTSRSLHRRDQHQ